MRKRKKEWKSTLFLLESDVHKALRKTAFDNRLSMAAALREAVRMWLRRVETSPRKGGQMGP